MNPNAWPVVDTIAPPIGLGIALLLALAYVILCRVQDSREANLALASEICLGDLGVLSEGRYDARLDHSVEHEEENHRGNDVAEKCQDIRSSVDHSRSIADEGDDEFGTPCGRTVWGEQTALGHVDQCHDCRDTEASQANEGV